ncbi:MAG: hypothetical protein JST50_18320 [Bacteroidetes bacterium]|jgi:hypothetical protein|nr:hypothetical protein [Bacteroidota bacterium]
MPESNISVNEWSPGKRQVFRFSFIFLLLYILVSPNDVVPYFHIIQRFIRQPFYHLVNWLSGALLHIPDTLSNSVHTSTDTTFNYLVVLFTVAFAVLGSIIWLFADQKSSNYNKLYEILFVILRYYLGITWIAYATLKIIHLQFPELTAITLLHTYGESLPRELAWNFMGYSTGFNYFVGISEYIIGILLFFRRTYTLGNLIAIGALINILAFNYYFDDNVKLLSTMLMVMSLFLLSKDIKPLIDILFRGKAASIKTSSFYNFNASKKKLFKVFKYVLIVFVIFFDLHTFSIRAKQLGYIGEKPPLYGVYDVKTFVSNKDTLKPLTSDTFRWNKLIVSLPGKAAVIRMNNDMRYFVINTDTLKKTIQLTGEMNTIDKYLFTYDLKDSVLHIRGKHLNDSLQIQLKQVNLDSLTLVKHKFHWVIEHQKQLER